MKLFRFRLSNKIVRQYDHDVLYRDALPLGENGCGIQEIVYRGKTIVEVVV